MVEHLQQFLSVPAHAECCGPLIEWDDRVVFAAIQHPGEDDGASTTNVRSRFPYTGNTQPRPAVIMVWPEASNEPKPPKAPKPPKEPKPPKGHKPPKGDTPRGPVIETDRV